MRKLITYLLLISCCLTGWNVYAQDPHYTQASRIPSWYNPAAAGHGVEHIRLTMLYRNQWSSVMSPFKTQGLFFDKQVGKVGFGANLVNNSAGDVGFRQLFINGQLSYRFAFGKNMIATGFQVGMIQKSFDPSKMTFDDQYTPDQGANPTTPTTETFSYTKITRPDLGAGILWTYGQPGQEKFYPYIGLSMQHINQPKESFIVENNFIPRKITANGGVGIVLSEALTITPMISFSQQQFAQELLGGVIVKMPLEERNNVEGGLLFRNKDAAALYAGYQWNNFMLGMSYDVNISGLTGGPGAFEITLTYIPKAKEKKDPAKKKEKDKKMVEQPKTDSAVKNSNVPSSAAKPPVPVVTPAPKVSEKSVPAAASTPVNTVPSATSKNTPKPATTTAIVPKPSTATSTPKSSTSTPATRTSTSAIKPPAPAPRPATEKSKTTTASPAPKTATATPKTTTPPPTPVVKAIQPVEKVEMKTAAMKKYKGVLVEKIVMDPKKSSNQPMLVNALPLENQEVDSMNPLAAKSANLLPVVTPVLPDVKKTDVPANLGLPANVDEVPSSMSLMTPKNSVVQRVIVNAPELNKTPVKKSNGLPIEKDDEVVSKLPTLIPAPVATSVVTDADQDGVSDNVDPCPYIKGSATTGGCPDTDGDGVIDMNDACPMEAGDAALNGCPAKMEFSDLGSTIVYHFGNIEFEPLSAKVHGIYKLDVIEPALDTVSLHDDLFIVISGHSYREGDAPANMELSQARADAVRAIFLKKGMPEEKIQTVAYGETVPLKNNLTEEGKQRNRRVEVHVIRKKNP